MKLATSVARPTKMLKHVLVYNELFALIQDGTYPSDTALPTEPELATQMQVSRMTLRRALALLQEDGLIENVRGVGNFVRIKGNAAAAPPRQSGIQHPFPSACGKVADTIELAFRIEPPIEAMTQSLQRNCSAVVIADRWYLQEGKAFGYSLSILPIEVIAQYGVELNHPETFEQFLQQGLYQHAARGTCNYSYTTTGNFTSGKYPLSDTDAFILMQGVLYDENDAVLVVNKHYLPVEDFSLSFEERRGAKNPQEIQRSAILPQEE